MATSDADLVGRHFTPAHAGPRCPVCKTPTVLALVNATGTNVHPACEEID